MEEEHRLPFATIIRLREDIAEVIVDEGVEMNVAMVEQYHDFLLTHLKVPFSLLINKINAYSFTPEAQPLIGSLQEHHSTGVVAYRKLTKYATEILEDFPREKAWIMEIFSSRTDALEWVTEQQDSL